MNRNRIRDGVGLTWMGSYIGGVCNGLSLGTDSIWLKIPFFLGVAVACAGVYKISDEVHK